MAGKPRWFPEEASVAQAETADAQTSHFGFALPSSLPPSFLPLSGTPDWILALSNFAH